MFRFKKKVLPPSRMPAFRELSPDSNTLRLLVTLKGDVHKGYVYFTGSPPPAGWTANANYWELPEGLTWDDVGQADCLELKASKEVLPDEPPTGATILESRGFLLDNGNPRGFQSYQFTVDQAREFFTMKQEEKDKDPVILGVLRVLRGEGKPLRWYQYAAASADVVNFYEMEEGISYLFEPVDAALDFSGARVGDPAD